MFVDAAMSMFHKDLQTAHEWRPYAGRKHCGTSPGNLGFSLKCTINMLVNGIFIYSEDLPRHSPSLLCQVVRTESLSQSYLFCL
jgi:hypothetical protein